MKKPIVSTFLRCAIGFFLVFGTPRVRGVTLGGWKYSKNFLRQVGGKTLVIFHDFGYICLEFLSDMGINFGCCLSICMPYTVHNSF